MAAPVQTVKCEQKNSSANQEQQIASGNSGLKNGTSMEEVSTDEVPGNMLVNSKVKSPNQGREVTMENFQDGGPQHQHNMSTEQSGPYSNMDGPRLNSDMNNYSQNSADQNAATDDYGKMNDTLNQGQMQAYGGGYNNRANYMADQHGGAQLSANSTDNSSNSQYGQYNQQNVRPGYLQPSKAMSMGPPPRPPNSAMMLGYNTSPTQHQQRFLSGHSISQQGGPTPTLNQLLQSPNPVQRYHNSYSDYNMGQTLAKGPSDMVNTSQYSHNWNTNAPSRALTTPYSHQMASSAYRNQSGPMDPNHQGTIKRPGQGPYMHPSYSPQGQYGSQYSQRYAPPPQVRPPPMGMAGQNYPQQYNQQQNPQQSSMSGFERPGFMPQMSQNFQQQQQQQQQQPPPPQQQQQQQQQQGTRPQSSTSAPSKEGSNENPDVSSSSDDMSGEGNQSTANPGTPTPPVSHSSVTNMRPTPSPSGSTGSRSMSPAISSQQNIPVPPRPSSQSESGQNRMSHSPMAPQGGYNQPMAPPHMSPSMYGSKGHPGMMGGSQQMGPYSPQNPAYVQGSYPRNHQGSMGMQGYGSQPQTYPGSQPNSMGQQPYGMNRMGNHMPAAQGYGGQYSHHHGMSGQFGSQGYGMSAGPSGAMMNSMPGHMQPLSSHLLPPHGNSAMMPPVGAMSKGSLVPPSGAQVAAQAAVMAAATSAGPRSSFMKHAMQQKAYTSQTSLYNSGPPGPGPGTGMPGGPLPSPGPMPSSRDSPLIPSTYTQHHQSMPPPPSFPSPNLPLGPSTQAPQPLLSDGPQAPALSASGNSSPPTMTQSSENMCEGSTEQRTSSMPTTVGGGNSVSVEPVAVQDEASQQSTASNTSNTDERAETPRPRKDVAQSHPPTPASTLPSPGAASMSSFHDEFESVSSPSWPRTPASPVVNSQIHEYHPPPSSSKRPDSLNKLYDISDDPERRSFLDRLVQFNDERGSALTQCPTISKQPLDLFKLYLVVKDRGGFVEVTKSKQWKDVAGQIGIGASSSAAYTLRKQYVKHLLPYECKFDRGGIDPQPIISQLEAATRKKSSSKTNTAPSPAGSSNSQDSFTASNSQSMDGFPTPPAPPFSQYSQSGSVPNSDYPVGSMMGPIPPSSMPNSDPSPHPNMMHPPPHNSDSINVQNPFADDMQAHPYPRGSNLNSAMPPPTMQNSYGYGSGGNMQQRPAPNIPASIPPTYTANQPMSGQNPPATPYSYNEQMNRGTPMTPQADQFPAADQFRRGQQMINHDGAYNSRTPEPYGGAGPNYPPGRMPATAPQFPYGPQFDRESGQPMASRDPVYPPRSYSGSPASQQPGYGAPTDQYRQDQPYPMPSPNQATDSPQAHLTPDSPKKSQCYPAGQQGLYSPSNKMMPPQAYAQGPKRHPDFMKTTEQQFPPSNSFSPAPTPQHPLPYSGWRNDNQFAGYGTQVPPHGPPPAIPRDEWSARDQSGQWSSMHQRYASPGSSGYGSGGNMPSHMNPNLAAQNSMGSSASLRQIMMQRMPMGSFKDKPPTQYAMQTKMQPSSQMAPNAQYPPKREIIFPVDSVEAISPLLVKRKRIMARDLIPVEAWRLMMSLKSGLLCESTWALDVLSVLLFDDSSVLYFSLQNLPGLLEVLMEHYRRCLSEVFGMNEEMDPGFMIGKDREPPPLTRATTELQWWQCKEEEDDDADGSNEGPDVDLGAVDCIDPSDKTVVTDCYFNNGKTLHGKLVKVLSKKDLFISDADKAWDTFEGFSGSSEHWQLGGGDTTLHIQTHFENDKHLVQFVNVLKDVKHGKSEAGDDDEDDEDNDDDEEEESKPRPVENEGWVNSRCETLARTQARDEKKEPILDRCIKKEPGTEDEVTKPAVAIKAETKEQAQQASNDAGNGVEMQKPLVAMVAPKKDVVVPASALLPRPKKRRLEDYEDEAYNRDEPSLVLLKDGQDSILRRCICISNILRSLSFVPGNDAELSKHPGFLLIMGKLLLLHHNHALRRQNQRNYDKEEDADFGDSCSSLHDHEWWWDGLHVLRENTLVTLSNIAGQLDLSLYPEEISLPILDGLLHWSVCPAAYAQDPLPTLPAHSVLSPQRLTLEALCKLSVQDSNVDLILATPPFSRIERLFGFLSRSMSKQEDAVVREFSVVLLHYFAQADSVAARVIACQSASISLLISFVEQAEQSALTIASAHGINVLRESPEMMGTSLDMLRRAANTLLALARVSENRLLFLQHQQRLLNLVMSQILDQHVAAILADVLYECSQPDEVVS